MGGSFGWDKFNPAGLVFGQLHTGLDLDEQFDIAVETDELDNMLKSWVECLRLINCYGAHRSSARSRRRGGLLNGSLRPIRH